MHVNFTNALYTSVVMDEGYGDCVDAQMYKPYSK
jgi:hypothetical protein